MRSRRGRGGPVPAQEPSALPVRRRPLGEGKEKGTDRRTGRLIPSGVVPQRPGPSPGPASAAPHLRRAPPPPRACGGGGAPPLEPGGPRSPPRPAPPRPLSCSAAVLASRRRRGPGSGALGCARFGARSVESEAATGARPPGPTEAAAEGSVRRQRQPRECEAARSGRDEPGWGARAAAAVPRTSRQPLASARGRRELGGWVQGTARGWVL